MAGDTMKDGEVGIEELLAAVSGIQNGPECEPAADCAVRILGEGVLGRVTATVTTTDDDSDTQAASTGPTPAVLCSTVPIHGLPPSFSPFDSNAACRNTLLERFVLTPSPLSIASPGERVWHRDADPITVVSVDFPSAPSTEISVRVSRHTGEPVEFVEALVGATASSSTSTAMARSVAPAQDFVRGSSSSIPFRPGGLDSTTHPAPTTATAELMSEVGNLATVGDDVVVLNFESNLETVPPGFHRGGVFQLDGAAHGSSAPLSAHSEAVIVASEAAAQRLHAGGNIKAVAVPAESSRASAESENPRVGNTVVLAPVEANMDESVDAALVASEEPTREVSASVKEHNVWALVDDGTAENFAEEVPVMARTYPFELDTFQKLAVMHMERNESVFVAAHTSAGKTVVAEYAIALTEQHMTRCIYTSPIKALSNQKFRDFDESGVDVGLLTGDIQLRPEANCLIMTTEILRSMLYRGADVIRDVEWVIFDEVHYVNDAERGVVWEEVSMRFDNGRIKVIDILAHASNLRIPHPPIQVIIMLPSHVNFVMLSATVPNTFEFADWVGRTKKKPVYVISTLKRPVPLEHFLFLGDESGGGGGGGAGKKKKAATASAEQLYKLVDERGTLLQDGYRRALRAKSERESEHSKAFGARDRRGGRPGSDKGLYVGLVSLLERMELRPCVVFTFSKKRCETNADGLSSLDLTSATQKSEIHVFIQRSVSRLSVSDRRLPQVLRLAEMLKRGIGVHHGGLLPILKEMVEILFGRGLVKVLFATETFAMGVNMPARCVVFDTIRKHDGTGFRDLLAGEYVQMAGRAGRRGLDKTGTVIILVKGDLPELSDLQRMMLGKPTKLDSKFRLTYNMILNLLRVEELRVEDMIKRSFAENFGQRDTRENEAALESATTQLDAIGAAAECHRCTDIDEYYEVSQQVLAHTHAVQNGIAVYGLKFLTTGRVVVINSAIHRNAAAVILRAEPSTSVAAQQSQGQSGAATSKRFSVLVLVDAATAATASTAAAAAADGQRQTSGRSGGSAADVPIPVTELNVPSGAAAGVIAVVSVADMLVVTKHKLKVSVLETLERPVADVQADVSQQLLRLCERSSGGSGHGGLEALDPLRDMRITNMEVADAWMQLEAARARLAEFSCTRCPTFRECYLRHHRRRELNALKDTLQFRLSDESLQLLPEYKQRVEVLKTLRYIDEGCAVQLKGRVACEISTCDELVVSELLFENSLTHLEPAEIVALLSCLVFQEKVDVDPTLTPRLQAGVNEIRRVAGVVARTQQECGMDTPVDEYIRNLKFGLVEVVHAWASGVSFTDITELTDVQEGGIVRCIVRLDETCRDVRNAARVIGDPVLYQKMVEASDLIKRDIVFAASLYTV